MMDASFLYFISSDGLSFLLYDSAGYMFFLIKAKILKILGNDKVAVAVACDGCLWKKLKIISFLWRNA